MLNRKYGRLLVVSSRHKREGRRNYYRTCRCECGAIKDIIEDSLKSRKTRSCWCLQKERVSECNSTHGKSHISAHAIWLGMISRCHKFGSSGYQDYGGRGIKVCARWKKFENFYADMGDRPEGLTLERKNNDGNYEPGNCKWATLEEQANNKRNNRRIIISGVTYSLSQASRVFSISRSTLRGRLNKGWEPHDAVFTP